jgi:replication factor A1
MVDVLVIVKEIGDLSEITTKNNKTVCPPWVCGSGVSDLMWYLQAQKRELKVADSSNFEVRLTLWGKQAEQYSTPVDTVIAFKGVRVSEFHGESISRFLDLSYTASDSGRSLSLLSSGSIAISPDIAEAHALKGWYVDGGAQSAFTSHAQAGMSSGSGGAINRNEMRTIFDVKEAQLGMSDKADFFSARATIMHIKTDNLVYPACPTSGCNKKMTENHDSGWRCEKCDRTYEKPEYRSVRLSLFLST